ncbi:phasin family protein [Tropicimonas sp. IMCC34043]|uniref:phasin family protein n=1 Tax=Tropicimonas sp. IMCC34043 TaxID=2248760 RepID=UPI000E263405|nr:phasin family protein [Tropicimonas sp. IMCC34043]
MNAMKEMSTEMPKAAAVERMMDLASRWQKLGLTAAVWSNPAMLERMAAMHAEWTGFLSRRMQENLKVQGECLGCTDPVEFQEIQGRFFKTAFDQYCAEIGKLVRMQQSAFEELEVKGSGD